MKIAITINKGIFPVALQNNPQYVKEQLLNKIFFLNILNTNNLKFNVV